jgi:hypothetical protein
MWTGRKRWYRGHGARWAEIAGEHVGVLFERVRIGYVGRVKTMSDAFAPTASRLADDIAGLVARDLPGDATTQCSPSHSATLVVGGEAAQGDPTMTGSGKFTC